MFFSEARAAASLVHPHVVTIHTIAHDDGLHLIEMEYVAGRSLQSVLEAERRLDATRATGFLVQIASALAVAHGRSMVHRDIKPGNVLITEAGVAKLADFGLAKRVVGLHAF
jgi:serine/threonine-protein kinase